MAWGFFTSTGEQKVELSEEVSSQVGFITSYAGSSAPTGWFLCQGQEVSISSYPDLARAIGTTYGPYTNGSGASGTSHFRLPDLRGRAVAGIGSGLGEASTGTSAPSGAAITPRQLSYWSGQETVTLTAEESGMPSHNHTWSSNSHSHTISSDPVYSHRHTVTSTNQGYYESGSERRYLTTSGSTISTIGGMGTSSVDPAFTNISINSISSNASSSHENRQPYLALNFIIKQ